MNTVELLSVALPTGQQAVVYVALRDTILNDNPTSATAPVPQVLAREGWERTTETLEVRQVLRQWRCGGTTPRPEAGRRCGPRSLAKHPTSTRHSPVASSHIRMVPSPPPLTILVPSGVTASDLTGPVWPVRASRSALHLRRRRAPSPGRVVPVPGAAGGNVHCRRREMAGMAWEPMLAPGSGLSWAEDAVPREQVVLAALVHDHGPYAAPEFLGAPLGRLSVTSA